MQARALVVAGALTNHLRSAAIPTLSPPTPALLAILMTLMAGWARERGRLRG